MGHQLDAWHHAWADFNSHKDDYEFRLFILGG